MASARPQRQITNCAVVGTDGEPLTYRVDLDDEELREYEARQLDAEASMSEPHESS